MADAQAASTAAQAASTAAAQAAALSSAALDAAKATATAAAAAAAAAAAQAAASGTPEDAAAAAAAQAASAAAQAAQAAAQLDFNAKTAAAATALANATDAAANATREAASFARLSTGTSTESAFSIPDPDPQPDTIQKSDNVQFISHVRGGFGTAANTITCPAFNPTKCPGFSALNFVHYENLGYDVMVANGTSGLSIWSLKDPKNPKWIAQIGYAQLAQPGETMNQFWEGENMTVDSNRKLVFMSRDTLTKGLFIIDVKDPWNPVLLGFQKVPQGHTATCINDCRFIWSVGGTASGTPARSSPVSVTDIRDALHPFTYTTPLAANVRRTGVTSGSTHSVDVDFDGVAWVSGTGGVRGWWTDGVHPDPAATPPLTPRMATPVNPVPYAGGSITGSTTAFLHNAYHVPTALGAQPAGDVMLITNENNVRNCSTAGLFIIASLAGTYDAGTATSPPATSTSLMPRLATYNTAGKPGQFIDPTGAVGDCSAHWFTVKGNTVALGNYEQGTRFVDISNPTSPQQVGYFRVAARGLPNTPNSVISSNVAGAYWHGQYVYISDYGRGIDVIKFNGPITGTVQSKACWNSCATAGQAVDVTDNTSATGIVGASVPPQLSLTLGAPASFGAFTPGLAKDYAASTTANVISTAGDAALSVADPSSTATGRLVNGAFSLPSILQAKATSAGGVGGALANVGGSAAPTTLLTYSLPISNDAVTVSFQQHIGATDALRTGAYSKTLTFTLSTTSP